MSLDQEDISIGVSPGAANPELPMAKSIRAAETAINKWYQHEKLAA
jgi:hypothetical protein